MLTEYSSQSLSLYQSDWKDLALPEKYETGNRILSGWQGEHWGDCARSKRTLELLVVLLLVLTVAAGERVLSLSAAAAEGVSATVSVFAGHRLLELVDCSWEWSLYADRTLK